ncbi:MAG: hypothetical protein CR997_01170 [Acidobacteria bacterium]|nr:MAG: hypothetical protein CR997_01170 [Acidobacteriota bacterium]
MKKDLKQYFDQPNTKLEDPESIALAKLLKEVSELETPDPGTEYWNRFNSRLQAKLDRQKKKTSFSWIGFMKRHRLSFSIPIMILLVSFLFLGKTLKDSFPQDLYNGLSRLSSEELLLLQEVYDTPSYEQADIFAQTMPYDDSEAIDNDPDSVFIKLNELDTQSLRALYNEEG